MPEDNQPQNNAQPNVPPAQPTQEQAPVQATQPEPPAQVTPTQAAPAAAPQSAVPDYNLQPGTAFPSTPEFEPPRKSRKGLIIGLGLGLGAVILLFFVAAFLLVAPRLQSRATADTFMKNMTTGNVDAAVKASGTDSSRAYLTASATKLKGASYELSDDEYNSDSKSYYLFSLTGVESKYSRVVTEMVGGKRIVTSLVYSNNQLSLKPGTAASDTTEKTETTTASTSKCFAPGDFSKALGYTNTLTFTAASPYTTNVHFLPDSLQYSDASGESNIGTVAMIATDNTGKEFKISVYGSVATTVAADAAFANQRAEKVKAALITKGVPAASITIDAPNNVNSMGGGTSETTKQMARSVVIKFTPGCNSTASDSSR